jgi:hypothetical protein
MATTRSKAAAKPAAETKAAAGALAELREMLMRQDRINDALAKLVRAKLDTMPSDQRDEAAALLAVIDG